MTPPFPSELDEKYFEGENLIAERRFADAAQLFREIIAEAPDHWRAHHHLAWILENKYSSFLEAKRHYEICLQLAPEFPQAYYDYAVLLSRLNLEIELEKVLTAAMQVPGMDKAVIYNEWGIFFENKSDYLQAIAHYKNALRYSFSNQMVETYRSSIDRCKIKMQILTEE